MCESVGGELAERARAVVAHFNYARFCVLFFVYFQLLHFFFALLPGYFSTDN